MTTRTHKERIAEVAGKQAGQIAYSQLKWLGIPPSTIAVWKRDGYLVASLPCVLSVGHRAPSWEGDLWAAVLYAGPGAMLSHGTAARWLGLIDFAPSKIHVTTPRQKDSHKGVKVHGRRTDLERHFHKGIPTTLRLNRSSQQCVGG
jgi:predicted transcriptional regulator of viral defense system